MDNQNVKCPTCKKKIQFLNGEGLFVTKNCSVLESDPETGLTYGTCKVCKTRVELRNLQFSMDALEVGVGF